MCERDAGLTTGSVLGHLPAGGEAGRLGQALVQAIREALGLRPATDQPQAGIKEEVFAIQEVTDLLKVH